MSAVAILLRRAASYARNRADRATLGTWVAAPVRSADSKSTSAVYSMAHPTGTVESEVVACGRVRDGYGGIRHAPNSEYIEMMHPPTAYAVIAVLERDATEATTEYRAGVAVGMPPEEIDKVQASRFAAAIRLAREILREGLDD